MRHPLRVIALACALAFTPACASFKIGQTEFVNPASAARTLDQRAYALLSAYAAIVEEATDIVRDPAAPFAFKRALGQAERVATPAAETLQIAVTAYIGARADFEAASSESQPALERAAAASRLGVILPEGAAQEMAAAFVDLVVTFGLIGVAVGRARARTPIV
jgi:hypothetical protein